MSKKYTLVNAVKLSRGHEFAAQLPKVRIQASDEYTTIIVVDIPGGQELRVIVEPDYQTDSNVIVNLK